MPTYLYFLLWGALFFVLMRFGCGVHIMGHGHKHGSDGEESNGAPLADPESLTGGTERSNEHRH